MDISSERSHEGQPKTTGNAEISAIRACKAAIAQGRDAGDRASVDLLTRIFKVEEVHED